MNYYQDEDFFYKVEENRVTTVCTLDFALRVEIYENKFMAEDILSYKKITAHEFNHAAAQVLQVLNEKIFNK
jgi:hypothetical protein